jgi:hypothetical protein
LGEKLLGGKNSHQNFFGSSFHFSNQSKTQHIRHNSLSLLNKKLLGGKNSHQNFFGSSFHFSNHFVSKGANWWNWGMKGAAQGGHIDLVLYFVSQGACEWDQGRISATIGGHMDIVKYFVSQGANDLIVYLEWTKQFENVKLIEFFKSKMN